MPNLTRLAERAILFENAYTVYPETIKSFFAVQCSLHPAMDTPAEAYGRDFGPSLATVLRRRGYRTGLFHSGRFMYLGMDAVIRNRGYDTLEDAGAIGGDHESSFGIDEPSAVRRILRWIDDLPAGQPVPRQLPADRRPPPLRDAEARAVPGRRRTSTATATPCTTPTRRWAS